MQTDAAQPIAVWRKAVESGELDDWFLRLYTRDAVRNQRRRYLKLLNTHQQRYGDSSVRIFSAPGRTELGGNHTDHNHGLALAGAVQLDCVAVITVSPRHDAESSRSCVYSMDFDREYCIDVNDSGIKPAEKGSLAGILRGIYAWCGKRGIPGLPFVATMQSDVKPGSGLSSSACIESLFTTIVDSIGRESSPEDIEPLTPVEVAVCGQYAENTYFGKPSGLLDQTAIASGGVVGIDFADPEMPAVTPVAADFTSRGYQLCTVHTPSDHTAAIDAYAAIPRDMRQVAQWFGVEVLRQVPEEDFWRSFSGLRREIPGRAVARAGHFFAENRRVAAMIEALKQDDFSGYLSCVAASGHSSFQYLQNVVDEVENQDYGLALLLLEAQFGDRGVVGRVHGGGFGGAVQAYVPESVWDEFTAAVSFSLGEDSVVPLAIRPDGVVEIQLDTQNGGQS